MSVVKAAYGKDRVALEGLSRDRQHIPAQSSILRRTSNVNLVATQTKRGKLRLVQLFVQYLIQHLVQH